MIEQKQEQNLRQQQEMASLPGEIWTVYGEITLVENQFSTKQSADWYRLSVLMSTNWTNTLCLVLQMRHEICLLWKNSALRNCSVWAKQVKHWSPMLSEICCCCWYLNREEPGFSDSRAERAIETQHDKVATSGNKWHRHWGVEQKERSEPRNSSSVKKNWC